MRVLRPLKRAKSTVGVPLMRLTVLPEAVVAVMLSSVTLKEVTLGKGASVPTTKADALAAVAPGALMVPEAQPESIAEVARRREVMESASGKRFGKASLEVMQDE